MKNTRLSFRMDSFIDSIRRSCDELWTDRFSQSPYSLTDCFMSAYAMFHLKYPSLLQFDTERQNKDSLLSHNLRTLYKVTKAPSDTTMRERLDDLPYAPINQLLKEQIQKVQRSNALNDWNFLDGYKLVSLDGTGFFSSNEIHCKQCCIKVMNKGKVCEKTTYTHNMLVGTFVNPGLENVLPCCFEPISKDDGDVKNDCEMNAAKRWVDHYRSLYPNMPTAIVADGLYSKAPFIKLLQDNRMKFILVAKDDDHKYLNDYFWGLDGDDVTEFTNTEKIKEDTVHNRIRYAKDVPLNDGNYDLKVNVVYYEKTIEARMIKKGTRLEKVRPKSVIKWLWVTNFVPTAENIHTLIKGGRARSKIENETFNTLKNQGYHFEHNFGHGKKGLSNFLAGIMLLAFLIDQMNFALNKSVQDCRVKLKQISQFFQKQRHYLVNYFIDSWNDLYAGILDPPTKTNILS